jgi:hypothetical protein
MEYWIKELLHLNESIGKKMAENAFKLIYQYSNSQIESPMAYLQISRVCIDIKMLIASEDSEFFDKLIVHFGSVYLKKCKDYQALLNWYIDFLQIPSLRRLRKNVAYLIVWIQQGIQITEKCKSDSKDFYSIVSQMFSGAEREFIDFWVDILNKLATFPCRLPCLYPKLPSVDSSVYFDCVNFLLSKIVDLIQFSCESLWTSEYKESEQKNCNHLESLSVLISQLLGYLDSVLSFLM